MPERATGLLLRLVKAGLKDEVPTELHPEEVASADWGYILSSARRHHLSGLLFEAVCREQLADALPWGTWRSIYSDYYTNMARNLVLFDHAEAFFRQASARGAPLLLLKGAAFAGWLYDNPALRPMTDLDVLVRRQDLEALVGVASELGYEHYKRTDHAVALRHRRSRTYLELHTSLTSCPDYIGTVTESLLTRSSHAPFWPEPVRTLAPEDHLLHLCLHGSFQHGLRQPAINACDVHLLSQLPQLDWERFLKTASTRRMAPLVYGGLTLCQRILPSPNIGEALRSLEPHVRARQRRRLAAIDTSRLLSPSTTSVIGAPWSRVAMSPGLKDTWSLLRETLRPPQGAHRRRLWSSLGRGVAIVYRHAVSRWLEPLRGRKRRKEEKGA